MHVGPESTSKSKAGRWGEVSHNSEVSVPKSCVAPCGKLCVRRERDKQDLVSPLGLGPGLHSLACPSHLNGICFPSLDFSICWVGQAPYPSIAQPACFWENDVRGTEDNGTSPLARDQARLWDYAVIRYLFIYSPCGGCFRHEPSHLPTLSPEWSKDSSSGSSLWRALS